MTKLAKQILVTITLVVFFSSLAVADEKELENIKPKFEKFKFSEDHCPDEMAFGSYKCRVTTTQIKAKHTSLRFVQYRNIDIDNDIFEYVSPGLGGQSNYLVRQSDKAIVWQYSEESPIKRMELISFGSREFLAINFFTGGTAGYWYEYLSLEDGQVYPVTESFIEEAKHLIPEGYHAKDWTSSGIWGKSYISFPELETEASVEKEGDINACPSGRLVLKLALNGRDFKLVSGKFEKNECGN